MPQRRRWQGDDVVARAAATSPLPAPHPPPWVVRVLNYQNRWRLACLIFTLPLTILIFAVDVGTGEGTSLSVLYLVPLLLITVMSRHWWLSYAYSLLATVLVTVTTALDEQWLSAGSKMPAAEWWFVSGRLVTYIVLIAVVQTAVRIARTLDTLHRNLAVAYLRLEQALAAQRRFVADASHELRSPLTIIRANAELLGWDAAADPADRAHALATVVSESARMTTLVDNLLALARADAGQQLPLNRTPLRPLLEDACRSAGLLGSGQEIVLRLVDDAAVRGHADSLTQLVLILLDNALKYTPAGDRVTLSLCTDGATAVLNVADAGIGISAQDLPRIFEPFYRAENARAAAGSGLGLAIARWIVEQHHGRIDVASTPGEGTIFTVVLPLYLPQ